MTLHILRVQPGADPEPPPSQHRVLISHSRWGDSSTPLTEDEHGAIVRYDRRVPGGFDHAQKFAVDWAARQAFSVETLYIETEPDD